MGTVTYETTTGDNDPEIFPTPVTRSRRYCDECGSFQLEDVVEVDERKQARDRRIEEWKRWLGRAAAYSVPLILVPAWHALGLFPSLAVLLSVVVGIFWYFLVWSWVVRHPFLGVDARPKLKILLPWLGTTLLAEWLSSGYGTDHETQILTGVLLVIVFLASRAVVGSRTEDPVEYLGKRCLRCDTFYAKDSAFFTGPETNPRNLTIEDCWEENRQHRETAAPAPGGA